MTALPTTHTFSAGEVVTDTTMNNNITAVLNFLMAPPILRVRQTSAQSLTTGTLTAITLDTEDVDSSGMHSTVSNTSRATAVYPGWYWVNANVTFAANATGMRTSSWAVNGSTQNGSGTDFPVGSSATTNQLGGSSTLFFLNVGDYVEFRALQASGGALLTDVTSTGQSTMSLHWVSS